MTMCKAFGSQNACGILWMLNACGLAFPSPKPTSKIKASCQCELVGPSVRNWRRFGKVRRHLMDVILPSRNVLAAFWLPLPHGHKQPSILYLLPRYSWAAGRRYFYCMRQPNSSVFPNLCRKAGEGGDLMEWHIHSWKKQVPKCCKEVCSVPPWFWVQSRCRK